MNFTESGISHAFPLLSRLLSQETIFGPCPRAENTDRSIQFIPLADMGIVNIVVEGFRAGVDRKEVYQVY